MEKLEKSVLSDHRATRPAPYLKATFCSKFPYGSSDENVMSPKNALLPNKALSAKVPLDMEIVPTQRGAATLHDVNNIT
jgi:hypothetical protein